VKSRHLILPHATYMNLSNMKFMHNERFHWFTETAGVIRLIPMFKRVVYLKQWELHICQWYNYIKEEAFENINKQLSAFDRSQY